MFLLYCGYLLPTIIPHNHTPESCHESHSHSEYVHCDEDFNCSHAAHYDNLESSCFQCYSYISLEHSDFLFYLEKNNIFFKEIFFDSYISSINERTYSFPNKSPPVLLFA